MYFSDEFCDLEDDEEKNKENYFDGYIDFAVSMFTIPREFSESSDICEADPITIQFLDSDADINESDDGEYFIYENKGCW